MHDILEPKLIVNLVAKAEEDLKGAVIVRECFYEAANRTHLGLSLSTGHLWLCLYAAGQENVVKQLPWFLYGEMDILAMCFDSSGKWLVVATSNNLRVVPFLSILVPSSVSDSWYPNDDIHVIAISALSGLVTQIMWWKTFCGQDVAILGSSMGEVLFIDIQSGSLLYSTSVGGAIVRFEMVLDDGLTVKYLMVTCKSNIQWRILLEVSDLDLKLRQSVDELHAQGYRGFTHGLCVKSILTSQPGPGVPASEFKPQRFCQFPISVTLSSQFVKGHHLVAASDKRDQSLQMYDSGLQHHPLFVYTMPTGFKHVVCTDYLIYGVHRPAEPSASAASAAAAATPSQLLAAVSCKLSERRAAAADVVASVTASTGLDTTALSPGQPDSAAGAAVVLQAFPLPASLGNVLRCYRHSHALVWRKELGDAVATAASASHVASPRPQSAAGTAAADGSCERSDGASSAGQSPACTVVDGCLVIAERGVLVLKPRMSPEKLFCKLCLEDHVSAAERLGIALSLDVTQLYSCAGDLQLANSHVGHALRLYQLAKCPQIVRVRKMLEHGHHQDVINYAASLLESPKRGELSFPDRKELYDCVVKCHITLMHRSNITGSGAARTLRDFLMRMENLSEEHLIAALCQIRLVDLLLEVATEKGFVRSALDGVYRQDMLQHITFGAHVKSAKFREAIMGYVFQDGASAYHFLEPEELGAVLSELHVIDLTGLRLLEPRLGELSAGCLRRLARTYDPSGALCHRYALQAVYNDTLLQQRRRRSRLASTTSSLGGPYSTLDHPDDDNSSGSTALRTSLCGDELTQSINNSDDWAFLVLLFVKIVIELNGRSAHHCICMRTFRKLSQQSSTGSTEVQPQDVFRLTQRRPLACGPKLSLACVDQSTLLVWAQLPPEGLLPASSNNFKSVPPPPWHCTFFKTLGIKVMTLSCGMQHGIIITVAGVFGWGSSRYGQAGVGILGQDVAQPQLIDDFACVDVVCGHYHSVAITADRRLFTWGWAVFGQLGLDTCISVSRPRAVQSLVDVRAAAAGHAHTLCLVGQGEVYAFGCAAYGQLGLDEATAKQPVPTLVSKLSHEPVHLIASGSFQCVAVGASNVVYTWGVHPLVLRRMAQLLRSRGSGSSRGAAIERPLPSQATLDSFMDAHRHPRRLAWTPPDTVVQVCCGASHVIALTAGGHVFAWGCNLDGQLGIGTQSMKGTADATLLPKHIISLDPNDEGRVVYLASGADSNMVVSSDRRVLAWGRNECRQLDAMAVGPPATGPAKPTSAAVPTVVYRQQGPVTNDDDFEEGPITVDWPSLVTAAGDDWCSRRSRGCFTSEASDTQPDSSFSEANPPTSALLLSCDELRYSLPSVAAAAKLYPQSFPTSVAQMLLLGIGALGAVAAVHLVQFDYPDAIFFHMKSLASCREHLGAEYGNAVLEAVSFYFQLLAAAQDVSHEVKDASYLSLLLHCLRTVTSDNVDVTSFEQVLMAHSDDICIHVCILLSSLGNGPQPVSSATGAASSATGAAASLSDAIMLNPLEPAVVSHLSISFWARMIEQGVSAWDKRQQCSSVAAPTTMSRPPPPSRSASAGALVTVDKLWQEVVQNLLKGCRGQRSLTLAGSELRPVFDLDSRKVQTQWPAAASATATGGGGYSHSDYSSSSSSATAAAAAFSCGHILAADGLASVELPELMRTLAAAGVPVASCALLADAYRPERLQQPGCRFELACPACVVRAVTAR